MNLIKSTVPNSGSGLDPALNALDAPYAVTTLSGSADAITVAAGSYYVTSSGVDAMTLAQPTAGLPSAGGNDGQQLTIVDVGGHAHTITCATNGIVPSHHLLTFGGTAGSFVTLEAYNAKWYVLASSGVTAS